METCVGKEIVEFPKPLKLVGKVETYLQDVIDTMKSSLNVIAAKCVVNYTQTDKDTWLRKDPSQITLVVNLVNWVKNVEAAFQALKGNPGAMKKAFTD